jgi:peptidoglycan-associated lipoprotein
MQTMKIFSLKTVLLFGLALTLIACGGRPVKALSAAEKAMADAAFAQKCAPDEYAAAEKLYEKAKSLADQGEHARAEAAAKAAEQLAKKAVAKAEARKEECLKPVETVAMKPESFIDSSGPGLDAVDGDAGGMKSIFFSFNQPNLSDEAKAVLDGNVRWLQRHAKVAIMIEGHCDERGSTEYNLALGEKRAQITRKYLVSKGVEQNRLGLVSYGEERLVDFGKTEDAHGRNRRAEFRKSQ